MLSCNLSHFHFPEGLNMAFHALLAWQTVYIVQRQRTVELYCVQESTANSDQHWLVTFCFSKHKRSLQDLVCKKKTTFRHLVIPCTKTWHNINKGLSNGFNYKSNISKTTDAACADKPFFVNVFGLIMSHVTLIYLVVFSKKIVSQDMDKHHS